MLGLLLAPLLALAQEPAAPPVAPPPAPPSVVVEAPLVSVGHLAPMFTLPAVNQKVAQQLVASNDVSLADFVGMRPQIASKLVVVTFVRRSDGDAALRELQRIHKKFNRRGVEVIAIVGGGGTIAEVSAWVQSLDLDYPVLVDTFDVVVGRYGVRSWPLTVMVDGHDALIPGKKVKSTKKVDDSGDVLALGAGVGALTADADVLLEELVAAE